MQDYKLTVHVWYTILKLDSWVYFVTDLIMNEKSYGFEINGLKR